MEGEKKKHHKHHEKGAKNAEDLSKGETEGKKKHHKHHAKDAATGDDIEQKQKSNKEEKLKTEENGKDAFQKELHEVDKVDNNDLLPDIFAKKKSRKQFPAKVSSADSLQFQKQIDEKNIKDLKSLNEKRGSVGKITKARDRKSSLGFDPAIDRIRLKKPKISILSEDSDKLSGGSSEMQLPVIGAAKQVNVTFAHSKGSIANRSRSSLVSGGSRGANKTPEDDFYDTEELRILNHEKMVHLVNKKTNIMVKYWKKGIAGMDTFASRHPTVFHNLCIKISIAMVPILLLSLIWDCVAAYLLEIPHYSMINHPGFMLVFHFISLPTAMYGYMMRSLMGKNKTTLSRLAIVAMMIHPLLLAYRCWMEWRFDEYRDEEKLHYEQYSHHYNFDQEHHNHWAFDWY